MIESRGRKRLLHVSRAARNVARSSLSIPNVAVLTVAQALFTAALAIDLTLTGLTGYDLASDKSLATLPFATITVAGAAATYLAAQLMRRIGQRRSFVIGAICCALGGSTSVWAVERRDFWLFCAGTAGVGVFQAFAQYYRLAAADAVDGADAKARVVATVLAGGVLAAILGPALAAWSSAWLPTMFAGSYLAVALLGTASAALLALAYRNGDGHLAGDIARDAAARSLAVIFRQPISLAAIANNVIGGAVMMAIMTAAPIAAIAAHHSMSEGASIIQWHLVGMYAPSLFAARLVDRFGLPTVLLAGIGLSALCSLIASGSDNLVAFHVALLCLGVGWNFMFVGGTSLLASSYRSSERTKVQGVAELLRYLVTAMATLSAGPVLERYGWVRLNVAMLPPLGLALFLTLAWTRRRAARVEQ